MIREELRGRKVLLLGSRSPGGAGVNSSEGQQVWLCWDLEPAADVQLWMLPAGMGAVEGGNRHRSLFSGCADIAEGSQRFGEGNGSFSPCQTFSPTTCDGKSRSAAGRKG